MEQSTLDEIYEIISKEKTMNFKNQKKLFWEKIKKESFQVWRTHNSNTEKMFQYKQLLNLYFSDLLQIDLQCCGFTPNLNSLYCENKIFKNIKIGRQKILLNKKEKVLYCDEKGNSFDFDILNNEELFDVFCAVKDENLKFTYLISNYKDASWERISNIFYINSFYKKLGVAS